MSRAGSQMVKALRGLTQEQRLAVTGRLPPPSRADAMSNNPKEGWFVYRTPTTIDPPTTLRLHYYSAHGKLLQVISITENGVTK